jgi:hypothetical protein
MLDVGVASLLIANDGFVGVTPDSSSGTFSRLCLIIAMVMDILLIPPVEAHIRRPDLICQRK